MHAAGKISCIAAFKILGAYGLGKVFVMRVCMNSPG